MEAVKHFGKIILNLLMAVIAVVVILFVLPKLLVFFMPFLIGGMIAACASPIVQFLEARMKIRRKAGSAFTIILAIGLVALLLYGIGNFLGQQAKGFIANLPQMWEALEQDFEQTGARFQIVFERMPQQFREELLHLTDNIQKYIGDGLGTLSSPTMERVSEFAKNVPGFIVSVVMTLLSAYFFVANKEEVYAYYQNYVPDSWKRKWDIVRGSMKKAFGGYLIAQLKIECWMYLLLFIGLKIAGVDYVSLVALGIAFLDLLPVFGTGTVLIPWAIIKLLGGHYTTAVILAALWGIGQLLRQLIQPKIVGESLGMSPIPTLFLLYIGWEIKGVIGMILAVPIGLVLLNLYREGIFETTKDSIGILAKDLNAFRTYQKEDYVFYKKISNGRGSDVKEFKEVKKGEESHAGDRL